MRAERTPRGPLLPLLALVLALALAGTVLGAPAGIAVTGPDHKVLHPATGEAVNLTYHVTNQARGGLFVFTQVDPPPGWTVDVTPPNFTLANGSTQDVHVGLAPTPQAQPGTVRITISGVNTTTGATTTEQRSVTLQPQGNSLILGLLRNPLPGALGGPYPTFAINLALWVLVAGAVALLGGALAKRFGRGRIGDRMAKLVRVPLFVWLVLLGLRISLEGLPPSRFVVLAHDTVHAAVLVFLLWVVYRVYRAVLQYYSHRIAGRTETEIDDVLVPVLEKFGGAILLVVGGFFVVQSLFHVDLGVFLAAGGFASIIVGLAAQSTLSNFFSGIQILLGRPFREGDDIQLESGTVARVEHIGLRATWLYHYRQHEIIVIPNNDLATKPVVNLMYPDKRYRVALDIGVAYGSDLDLVRKLLLQAATEHPEVITDDDDFGPRVLFLDHGDNSLGFTLRFFVRDVRDRWRIASELRERVDQLFRNEDVEIPFPQRTLWFRNPIPGGGPRDHPGDGEAPPEGGGA